MCRVSVGCGVWLVCVGGGVVVLFGCFVYCGFVWWVGCLVVGCVVIAVVGCGVEDVWVGWWLVWVSWWSLVGGWVVGRGWFGALLSCVHS